MSVQQEVRCATPSQSDPWMRVAGVFLLLLFPGALVILMVRAIFPASLPGGLVVAAWAAVGIFLLISAAKLVTSMVALRSARAEIGRTSEPSDLGVSIVVEGADGRHLRSLRGGGLLRRSGLCANRRGDSTSTCWPPPGRSPPCSQPPARRRTRGWRARQSPWWFSETRWRNCSPSIRETGGG